MSGQLFDWLLRRKRVEHSVVLFGEPGCHLCDDALVLLRRYRFTRSEVDITSDPILFRR